MRVRVQFPKGEKGWNGLHLLHHEYIMQPQDMCCHGEGVKEEREEEGILANRFGWYSIKKGGVINVPLASNESSSEGIQRGDSAGG